MEEKQIDHSEECRYVKEDTDILEDHRWMWCVEAPECTNISHIC